jgi:anti-sigma B factor antagonist
MLRTASPRVLVETVHGVVVARFAESELVAEDVLEETREELLSLVDGHVATDVLLNFTEVRLMSSTMLAVLLKFSREIGRFGGRVKLCSIAPNLQEIFVITRFNRLFEIHDEEATALDSF